MSFFRKKPAQAEQKKTVAQVLDHHMSRYASAYTTHRYMMTLLICLGLIVSADNFFFKDMTPSDNHIAVIRIAGDISASNKSGSAEQFSKAFKTAVENKHAKAVLITANSGGGSPVMSEGINAVIADYKAARAASPNEKTMPKIYVSIQDMCASACLASIASADVITAHRNSIVGSIGVRMDSFGVDGLLSKLGVERQVLTSGSHKDLLDPYRTMTSDEKEFIKAEIMKPLHDNFIQLMKDARGAKLKDDPLLFTGMVWAGQKALDIGLVDEVITTTQLEEQLKKKLGVTELKVVQKEGFSLMNLVKSSMTDAFSLALQETMSAQEQTNFK